MCLLQHEVETGENNNKAASETSKPSLLWSLLLHCTLMLTLWIEGIFKVKLQF